ncbi:MAG: YceI family protein [Solimonas sp.]
MNALRLASIAAALAFAACQSAAPRPDSASSPADPALAQYRSALSGDGLLYRLDAAASSVMIYVFRDGSAAKYGHNHVLTAPQLEGQVRVADALRDAAFSLRFRLDQLQIDDAALRRQTGGQFTTERSAADIEGTQRNMLKSLDAAQYPDVVVNSISVAGDWPVAVARVAITLHGITREQTLPLTVQRDAQGLRISGRFALRQTDYGVRPFSILGGALGVQDEIAVAFELRARSAS